MRTRKASRRRIPATLRRSLLALAMASAPLAAQVQPQALPATGAAAPGACCGAPQQVPEQVPQQAPQAPAEVQQSFVLQQVVFKGATMVDQAELQALAADRIGTQVTLDDLQAIAQRVTDLYLQRGYYLAQAVLPVQEVVDGVVEISVVEGRLGRITVLVDPKAPIDEARVRAMLAPLQPGQPLHRARYERAMLLLSDLPGVRVQSAIEPGMEPGTTDLTVQVAPGRRVQGSIELDNYGTREVGRVRLGGTVRWASPTRRGDNLDLRAMVSDEGMWFGRLAYETPLGARGLRFGAGASRVSYELGGAFEVLDAVGTADIFDVSLNYPLIRQRSHNLFLRGFVDRKDLTDELRVVDFESDKRVDGVGLGWAWERRDGFGGGGYWSSSGTLYHGRLDLRDAASSAVDQGIFGHDTEGSFNKLAVQVSRLQALRERLSLFVGVGAQFTDRNLDASEKLALGGYRAVRAYPSGEILVDEGAIANLELRYAFTDEFTGFVFYDTARGDLNHDPGPFDADNTRRLHGPGIGFNYTKPGSFSINMSAAWRTSDPALTDGGDRKPRIFLRLQKTL